MGRKSDTPEPQFSAEEVGVLKAIAAAVLALAATTTPQDSTAEEGGLPGDEPAAPADDGLGLDDTPAEPEGPTIDDVRNVLKKVIATKGRDTVGKIFAKFGAKDLTALDAGKYADCIKLAEAVLAKK